MRFLVLILLLGMAASARAVDAPAKLTAIEARYDQTQLGKDESLREKYILELATLRWRLAHKNQPGWQAVDAEIARHPAPPTSDTKALTKVRVGIWHSPRHDYLFRADGTWTMDPDDANANTTRGTWSIHGNSYSESSTVAEYVIILADADNFIIATPGTTEVFFEVRSLKRGFPIRRD